MHVVLDVIGAVVITAAILTCSIALWSLAPRAKRIRQRPAQEVSMKGVLAITGMVCAAVITTGAIVGLQERVQAAPFDTHAVSVAGPVRPLDNNASAGRVVFTFDDGPDAYTPALLTEMKKMHLRGVFFVFGWKVAAHPAIVRAELAAGDRIENHTWDHPSFTGASTDTPPLTDAKIKAELEATQKAIVAAGAPLPTLYRPPFGDITAADNALAAKLGLRIVQPFSVLPRGNIVDSRDWTGISAQQIVRDVTRGYNAKVNGRTIHMAGIRGGSVIGFHDSAPGSCSKPSELCSYVVNTIRSLPGIVAYMNAHHLGVTVIVPPNTTGGIVPNIPVSR